MRATCPEHARYNVGCPHCYRARTEAAKLSLAPAPCSAACPVCKEAARWSNREEQDSAGPGSTIYAFLECPKCGLRSREVISYAVTRKALVASLEDCRALEIHSYTSSRLGVISLRSVRAAKQAEAVHDADRFDHDVRLGAVPSPAPTRAVSPGMN